MRNCIPVLVVVAAGPQPPVAAAAVAEQPGTACGDPKMRGRIDNKIRDPKFFS